MDIKSMYLAEIEQWMKEHGQPAFRIEVPCENAAHDTSIEKQTEYKEIHTLPLEYIFSL